MNLLISFPSTFRWCAVAVFIAANLTTLPASATSVPVQSVRKDADGVTLAMSPGQMKLTVCSDSIVRVMYSPTTTLPAGQDFVVTNHSWPATSFKVADSSGKLTITTRNLKIAVDKATGAVAFYDASGHLLLAEPAAGGKTMTAVTVNGESSNQPEQSFTSPADEFLYGLRQFQEGIWNWRGMPQQLRQLNTQIAAPMIVSSYGYGLLWNNASLTDFNPADMQVTLTNKSGTYTTTDAGDYVFIVKDGDRRNLIGVQVNGQTVAAITNMWVTYTISGKVSDLRQSRRLDEGGAAQGRMALRAIFRRLHPIPVSLVRIRAHAICTRFAASFFCFILFHCRAQQRATCSLFLRPTPTLKSFPCTHIPGIVILWESPRQSRGFTQ